ncbi:S27A2 synthetase, partial [Hippolais icterina]|nr:S27A2 synthetase [Hippolais icterina]
RRLSRRPPVTLLDVFLQHARRRPRQPLLLFQDEIYTFEDVDRLSNRAAWALSRRLGLRSGRTVAVFLPNQPAYLWTWLALAKLGCPMACLNCNVRGRALRHALEAASATVVLASPGEKGQWGIGEHWEHGKLGTPRLSPWCWPAPARGDNGGLGGFGSVGGLGTP